MIAFFRPKALFYTAGLWFSTNFVISELRVETTRLQLRQTNNERDVDVLKFAH